MKYVVQQEAINGGGWAWHLAWYGPTHWLQILNSFTCKNVKHTTETALVLWKKYLSSTAKINGEVQRQPGLVMMNTFVNVLTFGKNQSPAEFLGC